MNEHHLNEVIVKIVGLSSVKTPKDFLEKIGLEHRMIMLKNVFQESLPVEQIPRGDLYVLTENDGIRYSVDSKVRIMPTRKGEFSSRGTFEEASDYIVKEIMEGRVTFNSIFFDESAKEALKRKMGRAGLYSDGLVHVNPVKLPVRNAGLLTIHQFYAQSHPQGILSQKQQLSLPYQ